MPSVKQATNAARSAAITPAAAAPGLLRRLVDFGGEVLHGLGRHSATTLGCWSNDRIDMLLRLEQHVVAAERALAAHVRLTSTQIADLTVELGIARAQLDEFYVGAGVDAAIAEVRNWEGSD